MHSPEPRRALRGGGPLRVSLAPHVLLAFVSIGVFAVRTA